MKGFLPQIERFYRPIAIAGLLSFTYSHTTAKVEPLALVMNEQEPSSVTNHFDRANNLIVIEATINGRGPFRLMIDTGSSHHVLNREVAETLGLKVAGKAVVDVGGKELTGVAQTEVAILRIGQLTLHDQRFFVAELPNAYPFQGILGAELFKQFIVTIDFERASVTLTKPVAFVKPPSATRVSINLGQGLIPDVRAEVNGYSGRFKIDTGYNGSLALFAEFVESHKSLWNNDSPEIYAPGGRTIAGEVGKSRIVQIKLLKFKSAQPKDRPELIQRDVPAALFTDKGGSNSAYAGAVGTLVLQRYRVTFNYHERLMLLEPNLAVNSQ